MAWRCDDFEGGGVWVGYTSIGILFSRVVGDVCRGVVVMVP